MSEILQIPQLADINLMELTICGRMQTKSAKVKEKLDGLKGGIFARIGGKKSDKYVDVFGDTSKRNHLHVDVMFRSPGWAKHKKFKPTIDVQAAIMQFDGIPIEVRIIGEFLVDVADLPARGVIRSSMGVTKHGGLAARPTAQTLSINDSVVKELSWRELKSDSFEGDAIAVSLIVQKGTWVNSEYLRDCEDFLIRVFNALVLGEANVASPH